MSSGEYKRCLEAIVPVADNVQTLQDYCAHNSHCSVRSILGLSQSLQHRTLEAFGWVVIRDLVPTPEFTTGKEGAKYLNAYRELAHATGVRLMSDIANNLKHYANTGGQSSYTLFSAHDSTLFYALNDLLIHNQLSQNAHSIIKHYPGFVANLSFQLYQDTSKVFRVRVIYYNSYKARQEHKGAPVLDMPLDQFYSTYFDPSAYAAIQNKDTCDYTRLVGK